jgi:outer membrane protein assembly factor BamD
MFSQAYYKTEQYYLAGYQFEVLPGYPKVKSTGSCLFRSEELCHLYLYLDQTDTYKAIDKLQAFIDTYPNSEYLSEANETVRVLQEKIEKVFENAKGYNTISDSSRR